MKSEANLTKIGIFVIAMVIISILYFQFFHLQFFRFVELAFCPDHSLTPDGERQLSSMLYLGFVFLLAIGIGILKARDDSWRMKLKQVFLSEPLCRFASVKTVPQTTLIFSTLAGLFLIISMKVCNHLPTMYQFLYAKDHGFLDLFVPFSMILSAVFLFTAVLRLWKERRTIKAYKILLAVYLLMIVALIFYAGEETSWGQDFFHWQTPQLFKGNIENQTNLHNYFNPYFYYFYIALSIIPGIILFSAWLEFNNRWLLVKRLFLPHPDLIGLGLLIGFVAIVWFQEQELLEEMVAVFALFYSVRIFACFHSSNLYIEEI